MDGAPPPEEDFSGIPIGERLVHKNWKARVHGYEALVKVFQATASEDDPAFKPYISNSDLLKKMATDANAVAQEKGLEAILALVEFAGEGAARTRDAVISALVDKCYGSARAGTKAKAIELTLRYVEIDNGGEAIVNSLIPGLSAKQPKAVLGTVTALREMISAYGPKVVPPKMILKNLPKIFGHTDKNVRAEGTGLTQSLYTYLGPALQPFLSELKPVQIKELTEGFEALDKESKGQGTGAQTRWTKAQARERQAAEERAEEAEEVGGGGEVEAAVDPMDFIEAVDIMPKVPGNFHEAMGSSKWKDRKEALDALLEVLKAAPKVADSDGHGELAKALAKRMSDANIMCVIAAANCIEALAKGAGKSFGRYRASLVSPMLERLKERKANVTDAIGAGLDAVFTTTTLPEVTEDILNSLKSKNPQVKEGTLKFLSRSLSTTRIPPAKDDVKPLSTQLAALLEDSDEKVRTSAAEGLGLTMKIVGERALNPVMESMDDIRKAKVKEAFEKAQVKCKASAAPPPKPSPAAAAPPKKKKVGPPPKPDMVFDDIPPKDSPAAKKPEFADEMAPPKAKVPARFLKKGPGAAEKPAAPAAAAPSKKLPPAVAAASAKSAKAPPPAATDTFKYKFTPEDADALSADLVPTQIQTDLADAQWKVRLAALEEMSTWLDGELNGGGVESEVLFRFLGKKPGWGEKNFQVSAKVYALMGMLAERSPTFSRGSAALAIPHLAEKLGDMKLKKPAGDVLLTFAEKTSLSFVLSQAYDPISKQKAPKVVADSLTWVKQALTDFGVAGLSMRSLIDFLKGCLQNSNAAVRSNATATLVTVRLFAGTAIKDFMEDLNPQLLATIDSEFNKVDGQSAPEPTRFSADVAAAPAGGSGGGGVDMMDELFPRVDLDKLVAATSIVTDAKSDQWKVRKEALELLQSILDTKANQRLKPNMGEIGQVLKARVADTNKVVQALALDIITRISNGMNKPFEKHTKLLTLPVATVLSDQKANVRALGISTLNAMATACEGLDSMCAPLGTALEAGNPVQRGALLGWLSDWFKTHEPSASLDLTSWASPIVSCLEDRNVDVRKGAQAVLPIVIARAGYDHVLNQTNSLKPASRSTVVPLIQAARSSAPAPPAVAPAAARPAAKPAVKVAPAAAKVAAAVESPPASPAQPTAPKSALTGRAPAGTGRRMMPLNAAARPDPEDRPGSSASIRAPLKAGALKRPVVPAKVVTPISSGSAPFVTANMDTKNARLAKDGSKWVIESGPTRKDLVDMLQHQMEPHASKELQGYLFSHDHNAVNDYITGLGILADAFADGISGDERLGLPIDDLKAMLLANQDLALKYASLRVHEPQPNLIVRCVDVVDQVLAFMSAEKYMMPDNEALAFVPTYIHKLGDAREAVRVRVQGIIQNLQLVFPTSRLFSMLLEHGTKSKVAKTRQGTLDELASILKKSGMRACDPAKAFPAIAALISDKDPYVRKSTLTVIAEGYVLVGDKIWKYLGSLSGKDKTQVEERLRRTTTLAQPPSPAKPEVAPVPAIARLTGGVPRAGSPGPGLRYGGIPRPASPAVGGRAANPSSPVHPTRPHSPSALSTIGRPASPTTSKLPQTAGAGPSSPVRSKGLMPPSKLSLPRTRGNSLRQTDGESRPEPVANGNRAEVSPGNEVSSDDISKIISNILSNDPGRSVDALKAIQNVLEVPSDQAPMSKSFRDLADHTEGLVETIVIQMSQTFERAEDVHNPATYRLMKHLIQTCNAICDHAVLLESLSVDSLQSLLEELTMRLLQTDDTRDQKVKDLSRFLNMVILRLFSTGRKISVLRALFNLLLQLTKPFPVNGTTADAKEAKVAELVLKCVWKLARNIPADLQKGAIDPIELLPALETFLQTIPPNDWRQRSANKVPCGDMPLRTIKVIIQHIVAHYADEVYELLSAAFDDPSATIIYPYVFRILNSAEKQLASESGRPRSGTNGSTRSASPDRQPARPHVTPSYPSTSTTASSVAPAHYQSAARSSSGNSRSPSLNGGGAFQGPPIEEPDPDARLDEILGHISSETTGALHKEGITELHHFLKAHPHKKARVDQLLDQTGPSFRKYIARALASRAAEDEERNSAVAETLNRLESVRRERDSVPSSPTNRSMTGSRRISGGVEYPQNDEALSRLHNIFNYHSRPTNGSHRPSSSVTTLVAAMNSKALAYDCVLFFLRVIINIFFREIRPRGAFNVPKDGPVIFVAAPHHNQFLDPILLASEIYRESHRRVSFLTAAKSMNRWIIGYLASLMNSIPVARAADYASPGTGLVALSPDDPCLVIGTGTRFTTELAPRKQILLPRSVGSVVAEVIEVIGDTEVRIKREFGGEQGKSTTRIREQIEQEGKPGIAFKVLPYVDQQGMYGHVFRCLQDGGCIGIFPEGGSHDRTDLLPLKAGVSVMALGAMASNPNLRVRIIPVGLSYFHAHRFRSRAVVEFGSPIDVPKELVDLFRSGGSSKRDASSKFLDIIYNGLKTVTVRAPDYDTLMLVQAGRRLYKTPGQHLTLGQVVELNKRFIEGYIHFKDEPRIQALRKSVLDYNRSLRDLGIRDHQVPTARRATWKTLGLLVYRVGLLAVWTAFSLPGVILNGPIFILASILSRQKAKEALAASTVKVAGRDVMASWKVLISMVVTPFLYSFYALLATIVVARAGAPLSYQLWTPLLVMAALPLIGYSALKFGEAGMDVLKSLRPLVVQLVPGQTKQLERVKRQRAAIANELVECINEFGPKLWDDFDEWRILVPSASVPPSTGTPGIWRRKTAVGGVDAQGNLLVHPMKWLDERLFGWSHSARRGTSAWAGGAPSRGPSAMPSPEASDDEDNGDYEHVLGYLPHLGVKDGTRSTGRSRSTSYADLQSIRKGDAVPGLTPSSPTQDLRSRSRSDVNLAHLAPVYHNRRSGPSSPVRNTLALSSMPPPIIIPTASESIATGSTASHSPTNTTHSYVMADVPSPSSRESPRQRRMSLNDGVNVQRLAQMPKTEPFEEATEELNRENISRRRQGYGDAQGDA
ncbi:Microtubule-associated protein, microtubule dynamics during spindle orientation [Ceratobasidium sp. 423]|nr:Microtubule-associated protein, microtubule dynamics during spindle orientation [Ceratobasidium sp. 423]